MAKKKLSQSTYTVFACQGSDCAKAGSKDVMKQLKKEISDAGIKREVHIIKTQCTGLCKMAPVVAVFREQTKGVRPLAWYAEVKPKDAKRIVEEHIIGGEPIEEKLCPPE